MFCCFVALCFVLLRLVVFCRVLSYCVLLCFVAFRYVLLYFVVFCCIMLSCKHS